jgi:hypothetical protein
MALKRKISSMSPSTDLAAPALRKFVLPLFYSRERLGVASFDADG